MLSEESNTSYSATLVISTPARVMTYTLPLPNSCGQISGGLAIPSWIKTSPNARITVTIQEGSCRRSWDMEPTTGANLQPSPPRPRSTLAPSRISNQSTLKRSRRIFDGMPTQKMRFSPEALSSLLLEDIASSGVDVQTPRYFEKQSLMILRAAWRTLLTTECSRFGLPPGFSS